ncbi:MAG TPA: hypothetical protein VE485_12620, partial [Mycobacterium sp.]|nr:hypothetical protein [Mycobacterium sp.]
ALQAQWAADPFPVLTQMMINQAGYAQDLTTALQGVSSALESTFQGLPAVLQTAFTDLTTGDVFDAVVGPEQYLLNGVIGAGLPLAEGISPILAGITGNISAVGHDELPLLLIVLSLLYAPNAETVAFGAVGDNIANDLADGNLTGLSNDLANGLSTVLGGFLNGYPIECDACTLDPSGGLLTGPSVGFGSFENIILALQSIATDIGAPAPAAAASAVDSLVDGASLGLPDLSTVATDLAGLLDPSTALADFSNLVTDFLSAL